MLTDEIGILLDEGKESYTFVFDLSSDKDSAAKKQLNYFLTDKDFGELSKKEIKSLKIGKFSYTESDEEGEDGELYNVSVKLTGEADLIKKIKDSL